MSSRHVIAIDLGAASGRVAQVAFDGARLELEEIHRFSNVPVQVHGMLHWDVLRLWQDIVTGINMATKGAASVGIDTWGVDFALLDRDGGLLANPVHYRDSGKQGAMEWVFERVPRRTVFERTGVQFMILNGLYQLAHLARSKSPLLDAAATLVTIADLFNYWLSGSRTCEFTHATTLQCYNPRTSDWDFPTLETLGIPTRIFPKIVPPGTQIGAYNDIPVIAPACHDTGSAVVAVPTTTDDYAYLSSGTWSLLGLEVDAPVINDAAYAANVTNEGGVYGTFRLLKNVAGLWIAQQCRATWRGQGTEYSYDQLTAEAAASEPFRSLIDPDDPLFLPPGDMPSFIREFCRRSAQPFPETVGQVMRTAYESLALKYRFVLDKLIALTGRKVERLHIIGGGVRNTLLCQMTADATGRTVVAGPIEATAMGNAIVQFIALGEIGNLAQARELLSRTVNTVTYEPKHKEAWDAAYLRFKQVLTTA
jgi:rhamnulokinase